MDNMVELKNIEIYEFCLLDKSTGNVSYTNTAPEFKGFTGLYFRDENTFFGLYPTEIGPVVFFKGREYKITRSLTISLARQGKNRVFRIEEYNIEINYTESPYIGFDEWSDEINVDLFYKIEQRYKNQDFCDRYTIKLD